MLHTHRQVRSHLWWGALSCVLNACCPSRDCPPGAEAAELSLYLANRLRGCMKLLQTHFQVIYFKSCSSPLSQSRLNLMRSPRLLWRKALRVIQHRSYLPSPGDLTNSEVFFSTLLSEQHHTVSAPAQAGALKRLHMVVRKYTLQLADMTIHAYLSPHQNQARRFYLPENNNSRIPFLHFEMKKKTKPCYLFFLLQPLEGCGLAITDIGQLIEQLWTLSILKLLWSWLLGHPKIFPSSQPVRAVL